MFNTIIHNFTVGITAISVVIGGWFGLVPEQKVVELEDRISKQ